MVHEQFIEVYQGVRKSDRTTPGYDFHYIFNNGQCDYLEVYVSKLNNCGFMIDNFPAPRRYFSTTIPHRNLKDFESDLERMRVKIPERKRAPLLQY